MAFVVSDGKLMGLNRPSLPAFSSIALSADFCADYATIWKTQPHVRTVVSFLARNIAQIGLHTFERTSDTDRKRLGVENPLAALIAKPNTQTTRYRLIDALVNDLGIFDVACWVKAQSGDSVAGLLRLPPQQIEPLGESWAWPEGVKFKGNKGSIDLPADRVVLFRGYNPTDARWGVSPMETLRRVLAEEYQATLYREQLWRNGARFPGHIERPAGAEWSDTARTRFRTDWKGLYTGSGPGAGGTPILEDGMQFKPGGITPAQAQYLETRKLTREEVAAAFHIPLPMVGILDHATFSNIEEQHKNLYQDTLGPWLEMIQQEIGLQLVPDFDTTGKVYVEFNLAEKMKGSFEEQATALQTATGAPWLLRSEARARMNLPFIEGMDDPITPLNVLIGGQASPTDSAPKGSRRSLKSAEGKAQHRLLKARMSERNAEKIAEVLRKFFSRQSSAVLSAIGSGGDWWDSARWDKELSADLHPLSVALAATLGKAQAEALGFTSDDYDADSTIVFLKAVSDRYAKSINETTHTQLAEAVASADIEPSTVFDTAKTSRADGTAAFVSTFLAGFASHEAAAQIAYRNDVKPTKTWITGPNPRAEHAAMDGETVSLDENFSDGSKWPGSGPDSAGCNCSVDIDIP